MILFYTFCSSVSSSNASEHHRPCPSLTFDIFVPFLIFYYKIYFNSIIFAVCVCFCILRRRRLMVDDVDENVHANYNNNYDAFYECGRRGKK